MFCVLINDYNFQVVHFHFIIDIGSTESIILLGNLSKLQATVVMRLTDVFISDTSTSFLFVGAVLSILETEILGTCFVSFWLVRLGSQHLIKKTWNS